MAGFCRSLLVIFVGAMSSVQFAQAFLGIPSFLEFGDCAKVTLMEDFDPVKYSGLWFDIETVPNEYQHTKKCVTQNYTWTGEYMNVATKGLTESDQKVRQTAVMLPDDATGHPASMIVQADGVPEAPYQIISTDYRTFSCVYSCLDGYAGFMAEFMWVFSRTPTLPAEKIQYCYDIFTNMGVDPYKMMPVIQEQPCPYFENLDTMLESSKRHLMKVLGSEESGSFLPVLPASPTSTGDPKDAINEVHDIADTTQEDSRQGVKSTTKTQDVPSSSNPSKTNKSLRRGKGSVYHPGKSSERQISSTDADAGTAIIPALPLLLLLLTVILHL